MKNVRRLLLGCIGLVVVCGGNRLSATETIFAGVPVYSIMSTVDTELSLPTDGSAANAFTPLKIPCPAAAGTNGCTFRVTVTSEIDSTESLLQAYL